MDNIKAPIPEKIREVIGELDADRLQEMVEHLNQVGDFDMLWQFYNYVEWSIYNNPKYWELGEKRNAL